MEDKRRRRLSTESHSDYSDDEDERNDANKRERDLPEDISEYESITETYDDDDTYDETTTEGGTEFTEGDYEEQWVEEERQSGDGQEQPADSNDVSLDDDEDRKNPAYIPRKGAFYEHDDRLDEEEEAELVAKDDDDDEKLNKKKLWVESQRWSHDKFVDALQAPKTYDEIVALYGYDIRARSEPPVAPPSRTNRPRSNRDRRNKLQDFIPDNKGSRGDQATYRDPPHDGRYPVRNNRDTLRNDRYQPRNDRNQPRNYREPPRNDRNQPQNDRNQPRNDQIRDDRDRTRDDRDRTPEIPDLGRKDQDSHRQDTQSSDYKPAPKNQPRATDNYRREPQYPEPVRSNGHRPDQPRNEPPSRGRGSYQRGRGRSNARSYADTGPPSREYLQRGSYRGNRPTQSYSSLRNKGREYRENAQSYLPPSPPEKWLESPTQGYEAPTVKQPVLDDSFSDKQLSDGEEYYYYEDIVPPVTTPYNAPRNAPPEQSTTGNRGNDNRNQARTKPTRKAASEDDLLDILPPTTTVYTASRTQRPLDQEGQINRGQGRPPKRYSSQRQRTVPDNPGYEGSNAPPVTMVITKGTGGNHGNMSQAPPYMPPAYGQRTKGSPPNRQRQPNIPPVARQPSPRQPNHPQHPRQPHHIGGVRASKPPGPLPPGQQAMFVRPRHPGMPYNQPRMMRAMTTLPYTGGAPVQGQAGQLYTSPPAVTSVSSQQLPPPFIPPASAVINYGPPPSGHFQIPQPAVPMPLPPAMAGGQQQQEAVHFPGSPQTNPAPQEVVQVRGGTVYFSPEMQQAQSEGVQIRGGTTYFNPGQQVAPSARQVHRQKTAIPIVNPEAVVDRDGQIYTNVQGQVYYFPEDNQGYEYTANPGASYDYYATYDESSTEKPPPDDQPANQTTGNVESTNQMTGSVESANEAVSEKGEFDASGTDSEECATPTNETEEVETVNLSTVVEPPTSEEVVQALDELNLSDDPPDVADSEPTDVSESELSTDQKVTETCCEDSETLSKDCVESTDKLSQEGEVTENVDVQEVDEFSECVETLSPKS